MSSTILLEPLKNVVSYSETEIAHYKHLYRETVLPALIDIDPEILLIHEQFLHKMSLTQQDYLLALRSCLKGPRVFLKRKPSKVRINSYNPTILSVWGANMDIQFCLDPWAVIMYIVKYMCKGQRGMSSLMEHACNEVREGNKSVREQVQAAGNIWTNKTEIAVQEAAAYILQLPFRKTSRSFIFINSSPLEERTGLLKDTCALGNLPNDSTDICADNVIKRYARRPKSLKHWCLSDFATKLNYKPRTSHTTSKQALDGWTIENSFDSTDYSDHNESGVEDEHEKKNIYFTRWFKTDDEKETKDSSLSKV